MNILIKIYHRCLTKFYMMTFNNVHKTSFVDHRVKVSKKDNLVMCENTNIHEGAYIMNTRARFIMKANSGAAFGLSVVTGNHLSLVGRFFKSVGDKDKDILDPERLLDQDVVVDEDVWIGSNVTLLNGVHIGRGAEIGSGAVVRKNVPPYSAVIGNPARVVGFKFTPEEVVEHEKKLYPESERLSLELLEKNYKKYFLDHIKDIQAFTGIICK